MAFTAHCGTPGGTSNPSSGCSHCWQQHASTAVPEYGPLIFADRISADERRLAFPTFGFWVSAFAGVTRHYGRPMCGVPGKPTANKGGAGNGASALWFHVVTPSVRRA
jgi:hypothetical protein